jgi:putative ABC transport system permease protein
LTELPQPAFFLPIAQGSGPELTLVARGTGGSSALTRSLAAMAAAVDPDLPIYRAEPLDVTVRRVAVRQQAVASLLGVLGTLTLLLAAIGLYGVAAHSASIRVREIGVAWRSVRVPETCCGSSSATASGWRQSVSRLGSR